jgi:Predicted membrane protein (DUF2157)
MPARWESLLDRWLNASLIDAATAGRIRAFESQRSESQRFHWPTIFAISFGGLMLGAGILLFVAAHWAKLSPAMRFSSVLLMVAAFHVLGAVTANRFAHLATVFHGIGTASLGAAIFLAAQIFNLAEGWDGGVLLWAIGAALGWLLLRDWVQATFTALLAPAWLLAKWVNAVPDAPKRELILAEGLCLLAIAYFTARISEETSVARRSLMWIGGLALIPCAIWIPWAEESYYRQHYTLNTSTEVLGWTVAFLAPLALAVLLRGSRSWSNILAALWVLILGSMQFESLRDQDLHGLVFLWHKIGPYLWCAIGSVAMIAWGLREARKERVNLGVLGFGLTIACFYFSSVMDKLGRSESLIGFGALFLIGGWFLERARRRLIARMNTRPA